MGIVDIFSAEDRVEITVSQLIQIIRKDVQAEMLLNGILNEVDHDAICQVVTGQHISDHKIYKEIKNGN